MKVLVACEFSGVVCAAFTAAGHDAWSCDVLPTEGDASRHIQADVRTVIDRGWDLLIAFPPCTHLCVSGARWFANKAVEQAEAIAFVETLWNAPIRRIAIENPIGVLSTRSSLGRPTQIIQPWQFGHEETKATCLWLRELPALVPTAVVARRNANLTPSGQNRLGPSPDRWKKRSRTYAGVAAAMAAQWGVDQ